MTPIQWKPELSVRNKERDAQHKELTALYNELDRALDRGDSPQNIDWLLNRLEAYTRYHCAYEAEMVRRSADPDLAAHRREQERLVRRVAELVEARRRGPITPQALAVLQDAYLAHLQPGDREISQSLTI